MGVDGKGIVMRPADLREPTRKAAEKRKHKMDKRLSKGEKKIQLTIIVDIIHVIEYLWDAGRVFNPQGGRELEDWVDHRILKILEGKAGHVAGGMRRSATKRKLSAEIRKPVDTCARYLSNHLPYLHYDQYLSRGLPIATGVIEGACRHLVKDRMEKTGARWSLTGAEAILSLQALRCSNDFDEYWQFHEAREYERAHQARYAKGIVPKTTRSTPPQKKRVPLRRIK